ncbi:MAG: glycosyl hydrolase family 65 protein [Candidatus Ratteibacteria bacterium]|nr:glycosyl hydrolase family 65 protein [Candidatus Ratteibacteria bacterium]
MTNAWKLVYDHFKPAEEGLREALCTLGNGHFGTRGAASESAASRIHYPGTYIAGVYNKLATNIAGRVVSSEDLVNCPNWLFLTFRIGEDDWVIPSKNNVLSYRQELDFQKAILSRKIRFQDDRGRITIIETQRIVHLKEPHSAAIRYIIIPENYHGEIFIRAGLDGTVRNTGVARYRQLNSKHLRPHSLGSFSKNGIYLSMKTSQSGIEICEAAKVRIFSKGKELKPLERILIKEKKAIYQEFKISVRKRQAYEIEKIVSIYTSRDQGIRSFRTRAVNSVKISPRFNSLLASHIKAWAALWKKFDIQIEGDTFSQKALRLHIFHLLQTVSIHHCLIDAGVPARGLHGEAYRGHIFWDELFVMPFFNLHTPEISKALLLYRYRRLRPARKYAREKGYRGAMFPWQSGSTGIEETPANHLNPISGKWGPDYSRFQRHISFAIAYNVCQYWRMTGDRDFLTLYGAEMILSIARFGASLSQYDPADKKYHTTGIMGPDEFHERFPGWVTSGFKDNAYTNLLIVWTLLKARRILAILPEKHKVRIFRKLRLKEKEINRWEEITRRMNIIINDAGIISQFDRYFSLKELDWKAYRARYGRIQRIDRILKAEGKSPNEYKIAKQADVLMMFYLFPLDEIKDLFNRLGYKFDSDLLKKNYEYYIKRTSHGSTLSKVVHCYIAHLLGRDRESWKWFLKVLKSDIDDTQGGTTPEGIHTGVMGGSVDIVLRGFAGINLGTEIIKITPNLPEGWRSIKLKILYQRIWISLSITKNHITVLIAGSKSKSAAIPFYIGGRLHHLCFGKTHKISVKNN